MLSSDAAFDLTIIICSDYKYIAEIIVFDAHNRKKEGDEFGGDRVSYRLPKGIYTIRVQISAEVADTTAILTENLTYYVGCSKADAEHHNAILIEPPVVYSSAPLLDKYASNEFFKSSHEYYTYPTVEISRQSTYRHPLYKDEDNCSLLIFLRFPSREKYAELKKDWKKDFYQCFDLLDEKGNNIFSFKNKDACKIDSDYGSVAANASVPPGLYFLRCESEDEVRLVPIYVFRNWHTQFFATLGKVTLFGTIRVFVTRAKSFEPDDPVNKLIDVLLDKLQNRDYTISGQLLEEAAFGKLESPMAGLLCLYIYLKGKNTVGSYLAEQMIDNIPNRILTGNQNAPDLRALDILAAAHFNRPVADSSVVNGVPMIRAGFEAIIKASAENGTLVEGYSLNDYVSENLFTDSPFVTFKEGDFIYANQSRGTTTGFRDVITKWNTYKDNNDTGTVGEFLKDASLPWNAETASFDIAPVMPSKRGGSFLKYIGKLLGKGLQVEIRSTKATDDSTTGSSKVVRLNRKDEEGNLKNLLEGRIKWDENKSLDVSISSLLPNGDTKTIVDFGRKESSSWLNIAIGDLVSRDKDISVKEVAKELNVSPGTVVRIIDEANVKML